MRTAFVVLLLDNFATTAFEDIDAMGFQFVNGFGGHLRQAMMLARSVMHFCYRLCDMDDLWLMKFLVDHWLNGLMNMMVGVFANLSLLVLHAVCRIVSDSGVLKPAQVGSDLCIASTCVFVSDFAALHWLRVVNVLLWQSFLVL